MLDPIESRYRDDKEFREVVDWLQALLGVYHITPGELWQAAVLATTMHEMKRVKPLLINYKDNTPCIPTRLDEWASNYQEYSPAMFGGGDTANCMLSSLRRADKLRSRETGADVTAVNIGHLLRESLGKPCIASISCDGAMIKFVPKTEPGSPSLDHVNPEETPTTMGNLRIICFTCNCSKSDLTLEQAKAVVSYMEKESA